MRKRSSKVLAFILCVMMLVGIMPTMAFADYNANYESPTHTVFKHTEQTLAPGVEQYTNYAYTTADNKQMVYYVTVADVNRDDVIMQISYKGMQHDTLGMEKLAQTVQTANEKFSDVNNEEFISEYYNVVSAVNGNGYNMTTGKPSGVWAMGGDIITEYNGDSAYIAIGKDGKAYAGKTVADWNALKTNVGVQEAINCFGSILVWDGKITITQTSSYYSDRASRTMVGITEDGKIVTAVVDGRQEPFSCGASMLELANIMLEAGCKFAINLDGGGSTTYMAKNEGSDVCTVNNRPSDGSERAISNGIIIASLAVPSNTFDHAAIDVSNNYVMPNASVAVSASGVSPAGTAADIPEGVSYSAELGTVENGVYTAGSATGTDTIKMMYEGKVVGTCEVNIVAPTKIAFAMPSIACPYGKTTDLIAVPTYGEFDLEVAYDANSVSYVIGDNTFGTIENGKFTATIETLSSTTSTITVKTNCTPSVEATVPLQVGRGSEIIWDFEDQDISKWSYFDYYNSKSTLDMYTVDATTGKVHNGNYALALHYDYSQTTYYEDYLSLIVEYNAAEIKAHGAKNLDSDGAQIGGYESDYIDITGACGMGFWLYVPDDMDLRGFNPRLMFGYKSTPTSKWTRGTTSMKLLVDVQHIPTDGWYYYWADLSAYSSYAGLTVQNSRPLDENGSSKNGYGGYGAGNYYAGSMLDFYCEDSAWKSYKEKSYNGNFTLYIDDWTVDYSTVVEDKQAPEFGAAVYACNGMFDAAAFNDGTKISANEIDFTIEVEDANRFLPAGSTDYKKTTNAVGLDASTAKVLVDGVQVPASFKNGRIALDKALTLADGAHKVSFEIADKNGNVAKKVFNFTVAAGTSYDTIKVVPHDASLKETLAGSLYYIDLVATDISKVNAVSTTLKVNNVNNWEPKGIVTADGFTAEWATEPGDNGEIYINVTRTGDVTATGEAVLVSIPVRAWYPHNALNKDSAWLIANNRIFPMDIKVAVKAGAVEFVGDTEYLGAFSADMIQIDNECMCAYGYIGVIQGKENNGTNYKTSFHSHTAHATADKAQTCLEDGYTGRTYCDVCGSVVDWGTTVPATGHSYVVNEAGLRCCENCGELFSGEFEGQIYVDGAVAQGWVNESYYADGVMLTGMQVIDGYYYDLGDDGVCKGMAKYTGFYEQEDGWYYIASGSIAKGWMYIDGEYYYFDPDTGLAYYGKEYYIYQQSYKFDEKGKVLNGLWVERPEGTQYFYGPTCYHRTWADIDGETYYFDVNGYRKEGTCWFITGSSNNPPQWYEFTEDGKLVRIFDETGLFAFDGKLYYLDNGVNQKGLFEVDGDYYYFNSTDYSAVSGRYWVGNTNGLMDEGYYEFDAETHAMILNVEKNGLIAEEDGIHFYVDGVQTYAGLVEVDGAYYYINSTLKAVSGRYWVEKTNGLMEKGYYEFGTDGKMIVASDEPDPEQKNGLIAEEDGIHFYVNGVKTYAGLVEVDGAYYYINSTLKAVSGRYWVEKANGLMEKGYYEFGTDGKMIVASDEPDPEQKNGLIAEEDGTHFYVNGVQTYAGLVEVDGAYYYINSTLKAVSGRYWVEKTNGLMEKGYYEFGTDGKMIVASDEPDPEQKNGLIAEEDGTHFYVNGVKTYAGLVEVDGAYYYINSTLKAVSGRYWVEKTNDLMAKGYYAFDLDGKMIID